MNDPVPSLQVIRSRRMGGTENWFARFVQALHARDIPVHTLVRRGSALTRGYLDGIPTHRQSMYGVRDPFSRLSARHLIKHLGVPLVQTYMERATMLVRMPSRGDVVHLCSLDGHPRDLAPLRHAHAWVTNSRHLREHLLRNAFPPGQIFHICNFAQPAQTTPAATLAELRTQYRLDQDDLLLLSAGRMGPVQGHETLLSAFASLPSHLHGRRLRLLLIGDGPLQPVLREQAIQLGVDERIVWTGWPSQTAPWLHLADLVVCPAREMEISGNLILEAWSYRKPLVATAFRGARELVRHGENGWIVPCGDPAALAQGIEALSGDPTLAASLTQRGYQRVNSDFSPESIVSQYQTLYRHLLAQRA